MAAAGGHSNGKRYLYYPGCSMQATGRAYEESLLTLFKQLDVPLEELEDWNCCGATSYMSIKRASAHVLTARNLSIASRAGGDVVVPCSACYLSLRKTQAYYAVYPEIKKDVEEGLGRAGIPLPGPVNVRHPLDVLFSDVGVKTLKAKTVRKWAGGRVACYYGCQAVRPFTDLDDPYHPTKMEALVEAVGIPAVEYTLRTKCCGGSLTGTMPDVGVRMIYDLVKEAARNGAEAILNICPLCQFNLDAYQGPIRKDVWPSLDMPVLYLTQVLGWALGADRKALGLQRCISGRKTLDQWLTAPKEKEAYV